MTASIFSANRRSIGSWRDTGRLALLAGLTLLALLAQRAAWADLLVYPTRLVFEGNQRAAQLDLVNNGTETTTYRIAITNRRMSETGQLILGLAAAQALLCAAVFALMLTGGQPLITNTTGQGNSAQPSNPFADVHGWDAAGQRARDLAAQHGLRSVAVQNWTLASRLGWYARPLPVHVLEDRFDQFDLWAGDLSAGADTLLVDWSQLGYALPLGAHGFADCALLDTQNVQRLGKPLASFRFYACRNWSGHPQPRLLGSP